MKLIFITDIHGDYNAMKRALDEAHYNPYDAGNTLICGGDYFGRAQLHQEDSYKIWIYLTSPIHKNKPICLRGNHEDILINIFRRGRLTNTDVYNGEHKTIASFAGCDANEAIFTDNIQEAAKTGLEEWLYNLPYYYETNHYIFTHGWVPKDVELDKLGEATDEQWRKATWAETPQELVDFVEKYPDGYKHKTIVVGHWTSSDFFNMEDPKDYDRYGEIYHNKTWNFYVCDCTTAISHHIEPLVIED